MRTRGLLLLGITIAGVTQAEPRRPDNLVLPATPSLVVSLVDGSRLNGTTTLKALDLRSEALGQLSIALAKVRAVKFSKDHESVTVTLQNGDRIQAGFAGATLPLVTLFGMVTVPLDKVVEIQCRSGRASIVVEWDVLPFPRDSNWPGPRGKASEVRENEIVFCGQPVRTKGTFRAPITFEYELVLDELRTNDGCLWMNLVAEGADPNLDPPPGTVTITLGFQHPGGRGGHLTVGNERLSKQEINFAAGKSFKLVVEVSADKIRVTLDGQEYVAEGVTLPSDPFHVRLMSWQPGSVWRVRNFRAH